MAKRMYVVAIVAIILLGIIHSLLTFKNDFSGKIEPYWFFSAGMALLFAGIINYMNYRVQTTFTFYNTLITNLFVVIFSASLAIEMRKPTAILVLVFSVLLLIGMMFSKKTM
ncbi:hypothetical protein [Capnocytophaga catalasegens]|uniref:EamA domain-containing protein n=1 Tax=Capnocytophaga catalasegens TaxID=1004260 RepID=A0AAV5AUW9_9FLAO|nr:hypothetical protein [Capnocytophaga catalasegens]GIZ14919.1 hypothetical protein RCZ03_09190 [Capnocytophaga catalasegens]GJM49298.1 hypothetical protein RCZ15_02730 [Capnocytophaga catalasegens]GJM52449.1 hypothetical protein RCZ16_07660 [Capnocytophaga catalasegens]